MNEREALLANVLRVPGDDTARLVYADYLQENAEGARAEFIRVQVEIARLPEAARHYHWRGKGGCKRCRLEELRRRERESWKATAPHLVRQFALPGLVCGTCETPRIHWGLPNQEINGTIRGDFGRGFVESVTCTAAGFLKHARDIFRDHPVTDVRLTDKEPYPRGGERCFWAHPSVPGDGDYASVPVRIFLALDGYENRGANKQQVRWFNSRRDALAALSRACVKYGRALAGLPPLAPA